MRQPVSSFGKALHDRNGRPSGFDYLRLVLSLSVLVPHAATIAQGEEFGIQFFNGVAAPYFKSVLPAFFSLSGFLVAGSMMRSRTLINFLGLRFLRIYPALAVEVILSALLIGPFVTTFTLHDYFTDPQFIRYLFNVTGHISFYLPGVFQTNPKPLIVNWQLWTVPWELLCYITLSLLIVIGVKSHRSLAALATAGAIAASLAKTHFLDGGTLLKPLEGHIWGPGLIAYFLGGVTFYLFKEKIPRNSYLFAFCLIIFPIALQLFPAGKFVALIPLIYCVMYIGTTNLPKPKMLATVDFSYGIYLYGYVIQQFVAFEFPSTHTWYLNLALSAPLSIAAGAISWYWIEKPALKGRQKLKQLEEAFVMRRDIWLKSKAHGLNGANGEVGQE